MKDTTAQEFLLMLEHQTKMNWIDRCLFGYDYPELFMEIIGDIEK